MRQTAGETFVKKEIWFFERAHEVRTAITSNLPVVSRSDFFSEYDSC